MAAAAALRMASMGASVDFAGEMAGKAAGAFDKLTGSVQASVDSLSAFRNVTGGSALEAGRASALFGALGLSMSDTARMANQLRDRLSSDAFAMQAFGRSMADARLGGSQNNLSVLLEGLRILQAQPAGEQRLLTARRLQLESLLTLANATDEVSEQALRAGDRLGKLMDPEFERIMADFNVQWSTLKTNVSILAATITKDLLPALSRAIDIINKAQEDEAGRRGERPTSGNALADWILSLIYNRNRQGTADDPLREQTRALKENTMELRTQTRRFIGGGQRTRAAVPAGMRAEALDKSLRSQSMKLGTLIP